MDITSTRPLTIGPRQRALLTSLPSANCFQLLRWNPRAVFLGLWISGHPEIRAVVSQEDQSTSGGPEEAPVGQVRESGPVGGDRRVRPLRSHRHLVRRTDRPLPRSEWSRREAQTALSRCHEIEELRQIQRSVQLGLCWDLVLWGTIFQIVGPK